MPSACLKVILLCFGALTLTKAEELALRRAEDVEGVGGGEETLVEEECEGGWWWW